MSQHVNTAVVVGAGAIGSAAAVLLAETGDRVLLVTRSGSGPDHPGVERVAADASDPVRLAGIAAGAGVLINCAMPPYDRWPAEFPPLAASLLGAAETTGAGYVMLGNVYGYGPVDGPLTDDLPMAPSSVKGRVRAAMWQDALASYEAGRARVTEVRSSDFVGGGAYSPFTMLVGDQVLAGQPAAYPGDPDVPHSWCYAGDVARTLVAAARYEDSWGRAWHVPPTSDLPVRELAARLAARAGVPAPQLSRMPAEVLAAAARADSITAEFPEVLYLLERPLLLDATATVERLGVTATPLEEVLDTMVPAAA